MTWIGVVQLQHGRQRSPFELSAWNILEKIHKAFHRPQTLLKRGTDGLCSGESPTQPSPVVSKLIIDKKKIPPSSEAGDDIAGCTFDETAVLLIVWSTYCPLGRMSFGSMSF